MVDHSPAPFRLIEATAKHGYIIEDALGDSIAALAYQTGDHPAVEQRANATLFTASPKLMAALKLLDAVRPFNWNDGDDPKLLAAWKAADAAMREAEGRA